MKNYGEGSIVASLSPILVWRGVVSWPMIPIGVVWRRRDRMAALSVHEPRSVCVSWRGCRRRCCLFVWSPFVFTRCIGAVVINSVANPSPRELSGPPCVRVYTRSSVFREHPDARRFSRLCFSLVCEYRESSVCVNFTSACFLVDVGVAPSTPDRCSSSWYRGSFSFALFFSRLC